MLIETIITLALFVLELLLSLLPTVEMEIPPNVLEIAGELFGGIGYFIPVGALLPIIFISLGMDSFQIIMALVVRIKSFFPTMGA